MDVARTASRATGSSPLAAFDSDIQPAKVSLLYTVGLVVVAVVMVLLPAIYIGLIMLVGLGVVYHLTHHTWILSGSGTGFVKLVLYISPAVVGAILVFFMLKPLLARRTQPPPPVSLDPAREALLFAFVRRICQLVLAPVPCRIDVDCQVNASASLRRGLLSRDLVLTIGLPLVAGLSMRHFAGVLAHEFGHFAQGAGMRLTYVIRNINHWFGRVVFERDRWDIELERAAKVMDFRIAVILHAARGCVWLTRRILWALMHLGHAVSCFMLRQMEYDADVYEAKVAGSDAFDLTSRQIELLNSGAQLALEEIRQSWIGGRLPENLPALIVHKANALPAQVREAVDQTTMSTKTRWFDTHPSTADRIRAVRALGAPGMFKLDRPARELFADFDSVCKAVTIRQYAHAWGLEFTERNLLPTDEMLRESVAGAEADAAINKFYGTVDISMVPLFVCSELAEPGDMHVMAQEWQTTRARSESLRPEAEKASAECQAQEQQLMDFYSAKHLTAAGFKVNPIEFGLAADATSVAEQRVAASDAICAAEEKIRLRTTRVSEFVAALLQRVTLALAYAKSRCALGQGTVPDDEIEPLIAVLVAVGGVMPAVREVARRLRPFVLLAQNRDRHTKPDVVDSAMERLATELRQLIGKIQTALRDLKYPFAHPRGSITVAEYARYEKLCRHEFERVFQDANAHVERLFALHYRLVGRVLLAAARAEEELQPGQTRTGCRP